MHNAYAKRYARVIKNVLSPEQKSASGWLQAPNSACKASETPAKDLTIVKTTSGRLLCQMHARIKARGSGQFMSLRNLIENRMLKYLVRLDRLRSRKHRQLSPTGLNRGTWTFLHRHGAPPAVGRNCARHYIPAAQQLNVSPFPQSNPHDYTLLRPFRGCKLFSFFVPAEQRCAQKSGAYE